MKRKVLEYIDLITKAGALAVLILVAYSFVQKTDNIVNEEGQICEVVKKWCDNSTGELICYTEIKQGNKILPSVQVESESVFKKLLVNKKYKLRKTDNVIKAIIEEIK
jgi:hypothetical protein